ncbi:MAG: TIGR03668 family PPOX class F420-dependent oxidoreductase [Actinomycetota bacterium]|nr:TIGR03668 family PPOX class F420-dependent oxidoreductase [Actinomycetota bacterium]
MTGPPSNFASLLRARRGYLGTIGVDGGPQILPVCFTWAGDTIWTAIDGKPKKSNDLQRLKNIESNQQVSFTVDRWDEDWSRLAWLQARGTAHIMKSGADAQKATEALISKYAQYADVPLSGPVIRIDIDKWVGWSADPK